MFISPVRRFPECSCVLVAAVIFSATTASAQDEFAGLQRTYEASYRAQLQKYCLGCHSTVEKQGDLDLQRFQSVADIRSDVIPWQRAIEMMDDGEMPPKEAEHQPSPAEHKALRNWIRLVLDADARANAGDPGPVVLRRLNNAEFTWTIEDLTHVPMNVAAEFPVDSAAGEGFTNVGNALVMSPALVQKYLDAARGVASHAMILPHGIEFSPHTTARDWTDEKLGAIRNFYARYSDSSGATSVNLQGIQFETNGGGRLPVETYLLATIADRAGLADGTLSFEESAKRHGISSRYLEMLWRALNDTEPSLLLDPIRNEWKTATTDDVHRLTIMIGQWQQALWRFTTVGHIGKRDGPKAWQVSVDPLAVRQELRKAMVAPSEGSDIHLYLVTSDVGDGNSGDFAVWENARFVTPGQPDLLLKDVKTTVGTLQQYREKTLASATACLEAAAELTADVQENSKPDSTTPAPATEDPAVKDPATQDPKPAEPAAQEPASPTAPVEISIQSLAEKHNVDEAILAAWFNYLGVGHGEAEVAGHLTSRMERAESYEFVKGWVGADALSVIANSSDEFVRVPGDLKPHSVAVHPSPSVRVAVGWKSPVDGLVKIQGKVQRAHMACGNGVTWLLELRKGRTRQRLAAGVAGGPEEHVVGPFEQVRVRKGDLLSLIIGPRDGNHSCDLTAISLSVSAGEQEWDLATDITPDLLSGNPHDDRHGNHAVWHFYGEPDKDNTTDSVIPQGSILARWQSAATSEERLNAANELQKLLTDGPSSLAADSPDLILYRQLSALNGPLLSSLRTKLQTGGISAGEAPTSTYGLEPQMFGTHPDGSAIGASDLCIKAPEILEVVVPADLVAGGEFVATGGLHQPTGSEGSIQLQVLTQKPESATAPSAGGARPSGGKSTWSDGERPLMFDSPILVSESSQARTRVLTHFDQFRQLFPVALCYTKIVPVDEVVTLTLYYREDDHLKRLMLNEEEAAELDRLWDDMHYVSRSALALVDAYEQLWQFATQDADPSAFTPMKEGIMKNAELFRQRMTEAEPVHIQAILKFADQAWRRPLSESEQKEILDLYHRLRAEELDHESAIRMLIARILVTPEFLYRIEQPPAGAKAAAVSNAELATRLSYFLWSSMPDQQLRSAADNGELQNPERLRSEMRRMLADAKTRRLAIEFGCQWLHVREFDQMDEKSEQHYPEFKELRADMYEETIRFFEDMFRNDQSILNLLDADYVFVNDRLASFYGISGVSGSEWRRVEGAKSHSRGGILTLASTLSKQSGASRTSPILRGNWVSEFLLGDKLPKPPKGVPLLPEEAPADVTERQLIETHSSDPACAKCHHRIDPFGFAMEKFDTIGRRRDEDKHGHSIDVATVLPDGTPVNGVEGLRDYLLNKRRDDFLRTFCRRLLGYALGRSTQLSDEPLIDEMLKALSENDYRFSVAVEKIVLSPQFRNVRGADAVSVHE